MGVYNMVLGGVLAKTRSGESGPITIKFQAPTLQKFHLFQGYS